MRTVRIALAVVCSWAPMVRAQAHEETGATPPPPIQDNSFLLEEAYNQEPGIVQHINLFLRDLRTGEWFAAFTQEYPVTGLRHQLSYTIPYRRFDSAGRSFDGLGDIALNYRYQLVGSGETRLAAAPRLTVFLPTGDFHRGLGAGSAGVQLGFAVSAVASEDLVFHGNIGATYRPSARDTAGDKADAWGGYLGGSAIWLGLGRVNPMLEVLWTRDQIVAGPARTRIDSTLTINPGVRWALDSRSGLQVVPGLSFPIGIGPSAGSYGILLYLSFEHPMWSAPAR